MTNFAGYTGAFFGISHGDTLGTSTLFSRSSMYDKQ